MSDENPESTEKEYPIAESGLQRVEVDNPNRCQSVHASQQCPYKAVEGSKYCPRHGGNLTRKTENNANHRKFMAAKWMQKIGFQTDHPEMKSLREETGILRMLLENKLNQCNDVTELSLSSSIIIELVREITKTVKTLHAIEVSCGMMLDKTQATAFITGIVEIISEFLPNPDDIASISDRLANKLQDLIKAADPTKQIDAYKNFRDQ